MAKGILVDYEWCSGCHTCEMACAVELSHDFPGNHAGIRVVQEGPYKIGEKNGAALTCHLSPTCVTNAQIACQ